MKSVLRSKVWDAPRGWPGPPVVHTGALLVQSCCPWGTCICLGTRLIFSFATKRELPN